MSMAKRYANWLDRRVEEYDRDGKRIHAEVTRQAARELRTLDAECKRLRVLEAENRRLRAALEEAGDE